MTIDRNEIYFMECIEGMSHIPAKSVDMILCDLPYGTTQCKWDTVIPFDKLWQQYERIIKDNGAIVLTAAEPFTSLLVSSNIKKYKHGWVWVKNNATGHLNAKRMPMRLFENILVFSCGVPEYNPQDLVPFNKKVRRGGNGENYGVSGVENFQEFTNYPTDILCFDSDTSKLHPTQKPVALFEYLIRTYTNEGDLVLDNCGGSGTTAIACMNTGRDFILFENDPEHFEKSTNRVIDKILG